MAKIPKPVSSPTMDSAFVAHAPERTIGTGDDIELTNITARGVLSEVVNEEPVANCIEPNGRRNISKVVLDTSHDHERTQANENTAKNEDKETVKTHEPKIAPLTPAALDNGRAERARLLLEGLSKCYLQAGDKFHFRNRPSIVAFEAQDRKLLTLHNEPAVVSSMIDLAEARGWTTLKLTGTKEFRREAWLQARLRDIEIGGYRPDKLDKIRLDEVRGERSGLASSSNTRKTNEPKTVKNRRASLQSSRFQTVDDIHHHEPTVSLTKEQSQVVRVLEVMMRERGDTAQVIEKASEIASERFRKDRVHVGTLVDVGTTPYQDRLGEKPSHYVMLEDDKGQSFKVWGVDLPRAFEESGSKLGDKVVLAFKGRQAVTIDGPAKDVLEQVTRMEKKPVERNVWEIVSFNKLRDAAKTRAVQSAKRAKSPSKLQVFDREALSRVQPQSIAAERARSQERAI